MKKITLVSSFSESCGNAFFTEVLLNGLADEGYQADCASLDLALTQSMEWAIRRKADSHIDEICNRLKLADGVNIQFEAGLYGTLPADVFKRFKKILLANNNTSVTLHSPRLMGAASGFREAIRLFFTGRIKSAIKKYFEILKSDVHVKLNRKVVAQIVKNGSPIIVHTIRAKEQIYKLYDYENVLVHPLKFVSEERKINNEKLLKLKEQYSFDANVKTIGMFGYISLYKGHTAALEAIKRLPDNYKLLIFGRVHPQSIKLSESVDPYISNLDKFITKNKLENKVYFVGEVNTEDFIDYAGSVDCAWLPYLEVGQDGSGIASICCDVATNVLASNSFAFDELLKLIPYKTMRRFDIGNSMELAQKTLLKVDTSNLDDVKNSTFNVKSQAIIYKQSVNF